MRIGANYLGDKGCEFVVWAPLLNKVELKIISPEERTVPMDRDRFGYWNAVIEDISPGTLYLYRLGSDKERPDPASYFQPSGVHEHSQVVDHNSFEWKDETWRGMHLSRLIIYELHVGTFTPEGTFESVIPRLDELRDSGVNAIEIMPIAQFPGERNWGYDGVYPFAAQNSYGGPEGLKKLVNECHKKGMAVVLDVVYNHVGPEGNYLRDFAPYFTDKYRTPWGDAINFDDAYSYGVRNFFIENAIYWFKNYHIDALRLDAVHAIYDMSAKHFLEELAERVEGFSKQEMREFYLIAESNLNDVRMIRPRDLGGYGIDAQWCDDFHHSLRVLITGDRSGYYVDFGTVENLVKSFREGFVYSGRYSEYRKRNFGNSSKGRPGEQFVVFTQNHDHIGNRILGERLSSQISFEGVKLAAGVVLLSPFVPMLFMGEEYGEETPFLYFVSHSDPDLIEAVREGRKEEFRAFKWKEEPPDPQSEETFLKSILNWEKRKEGKHKILLDFYKTLISLRREIPALTNLDKDSLDACGFEKEKVVLMRRWKGDSHIFSIFNLNDSDQKVKAPSSGGEWKKILDSSDKVWSGPGAILSEKLNPGDKVTIRGLSLALYKKE
ncbi:MAG TPA: malto-oligosyltrehalose trehalohydrolase [Thermodesulfobacteriota bacterium]|nr:malto-oligosyltrehalose trehalohydrolase [Thermodesulfobacteriota bacterium]